VGGPFQSPNQEKEGFTYRSGFPFTTNRPYKKESQTESVENPKKVKFTHSQIHERKRKRIYTDGTEKWCGTEGGKLGMDRRKTSAVIRQIKTRTDLRENYLRKRRQGEAVKEAAHFAKRADGVEDSFLEVLGVQGKEKRKKEDGHTSRARPKKREVPKRQGEIAPNHCLPLRRFIRERARKSHLEATRGGKCGHGRTGTVVVSRVKTTAS